MRKKYYDCYSIGQMKFLRNNGIEPIKVRIHHASGNTIWVFSKNHELDKLLTKWTNRRKLAVQKWGRTHFI